MQLWARFLNHYAMTNKLNSPSLAFCLLMDAAGYLTYAIPVLGEFGDLFWAPISAVIFMISFGGWKGILGGTFNFIEEILPGTDFIPSFTIAWLLKRRTVPAIR
jgi:hypothetical protein